MFKYDNNTLPKSISELFVLNIVSEPNPLRPLRNLQYGLGETLFGGCRHFEYMNIWGFNEQKYYLVCLRQEAQMFFF